MSANFLTRNDYAEGTAAKHFFFSAIVMLNIGVLMALGTSVRLAWPDALPNDIAWLHFGRIRPVHVHFVIFGWISMAFAGAMCYMTPALCKSKLWSERLGVWNCWAWNFGMVAVFFTLINGLTSGREYQDLIWPLDVYVLLFIFLPLAVNIWMTMLTRAQKGLYVTLWFFGASLLFILLSYFIGAVPDFFPVTGLAEAYMTWWHAHNILGLWITPVSAAIAYYLIPKVSGNTLYSHKIGHLHFWSIAAFYSTPGAHHLMGAPIPEWLKSFASVSGVLIMIPALAFVVNMLMTMKDKWWMFTRSIPLQWALTGVLFAIPLNIQGAFQQTRALNWYIHGTHWIVAHAHLALLGFSTFIEIGAIYYGLPKLLKRELYSEKLARLHFWMMAIGFLGFWAVLTAAGLVQGAAKVYEIPYIQSVVATHPYMVGRVIFGSLIIFAQPIFLYNMWMTARHGRKLAPQAGPGAMPAPAAA